jgi:hypothetical protein
MDQKYYICILIAAVLIIGLVLFTTPSVGTGLGFQEGFALLTIGTPNSNRPIYDAENLQVGSELTKGTVGKTPIIDGSFTLYNLNLAFDFGDSLKRLGLQLIRARLPDFYHSGDNVATGDIESLYWKNGDGDSRIYVFGLPVTNTTTLFYRVFKVEVLVKNISTFLTPNKISNIGHGEFKTGIPVSNFENATKVLGAILDQSATPPSGLSPADGISSAWLITNELGLTEPFETSSNGLHI